MSCCYFSYSINGYVYDDDEEEIQVTYEVEGWYHPVIHPDPHADNEIEFYGQPGWYDYEVLKIINQTDDRKIEERWIHDPDVHEMIVQMFQKQNKSYFDC